MIKKSNGWEGCNSLPSQMDLEFLEALLAPEDATYPWNPASSESEAYFLQVEEQFLLEEVLDEELSVRSQGFHDTLDSLWAGVSSQTHYNCSTEPQVITDIQKSLQNNFAIFPQSWLKTIVQKAVEVVNSQQSMGEQLVQCVQSVLPTWGTEDLLVLARPYAYAMRSGESHNVESSLKNVGERNWTELSEIEQAKASLAIAYYTLNQLDSSFRTQS